MLQLLKLYILNRLAGCKGPAAEGLLRELLSISVILSISCMSVCLLEMEGGDLFTK